VPGVYNPGVPWDGVSPANVPLLFSNAEARPLLQAGSYVNGKLVGHAIQDVSQCMQTPKMETGDEASLSISSLQDRVFAPSVESVVNAWHTFGPIGGPTKLMSTVLRYRLFGQAVTGMAPVAYPGDGVVSGHIMTIFRSEMTFKRDLTIHQLELIRSTVGECSHHCTLRHAWLSCGWRCDMLG
jgi:hypothetical protein